MKSLRDVSLALFLLGFATCQLPDGRGKVVARARLTSLGTAEARLPANHSTIELWAHLDGRHKANHGRRSEVMPILYSVDVLQGGKIVSTVSCDPQTSSEVVCDHRDNIFGELDASCDYRLKCVLPSVLSAADHVLRVTARASESERIVSLRDVSLLVREAP